MKNQVYKLNDGENAKDASTLEFFVVDTNEIGIVVLKEGMQLDFDLDQDATKSLIKYLKESLDYIQDLNKRT